MLELEDAIARILAITPTSKSELIPLTRARRRVLAQSVHARVDLPSFDNSAMDGYAVRASDLSKASADQPVRLQLRGRIAAGENSNDTVEPGACVRVFTGSLLPAGADAVVMQEDTNPGQHGEVLINDSVKPWENVRFRGEDVKRGTVLAEDGELLGAGKISLLTATGVSHVEVGRQPRVAVVATGSELCEPGMPLATGQIYESNRAGLAVLLEDIGACPSIFPLVADTREEVRKALEKAFKETDIVISSGGVSVGEMDFIKTALKDLGGEMEFWRVAIKPGRPFAFGRYRDKLFFGLPGNPVSALTTFWLLARPSLLRWQGAKDVSLPLYHGVLGERLANPGERRHFMRVKIDALGQVFSAGLQGSHVLSSLAEANGLLELPPGVALEAGTRLKVIRWDR
jgi:molybdopterin molybdotransferase